MPKYFENITVGLHVFYILKTQKIPCQLDVIYHSIHTLLCMILDYKNLKFKHLIDGITIDLWFSGNFASIKDIKKIYNQMEDLLKFTFRKKILSGIVTKICPLN